MGVVGNLGTCEVILGDLLVTLKKVASPSIREKGFRLQVAGGQRY